MLKVHLSTVKLQGTPWQMGYLCYLVYVLRGK
jgi:hypothetical protein